MAHSKSFFGLRRGSTKSLTFQVLKGKQITKDRVDVVANPRTTLQMIQRVAFGTVTLAAEKMIDIIGISQQGVNDKTENRRRFVSRNVKLLSTYAKSILAGGDIVAAFAPKGCTQLVPNSYQVSYGSLNVPALFVPKTASESGASFADDAYAKVGKLTGLPFGEYTLAQLYSTLFGLRAGDQLTFPQIFGGYGTEKELFNGQGSTIDKTLYTQFAAPRIVLKNEFPEQTITIDDNITAIEIIAFLKDAISEEDSWPIYEAWLDAISIDDAADDILVLDIDTTYDLCFAANDDDPLLAIGCILSRKDTSTGKWQYSTSYLVCAYAPALSDVNYWGFKLQNAIETHLPSVTTDGEGNFLQRGGSADIVPESFM